MRRNVRPFAVLVLLLLLVFAVEALVMLALAALPAMPWFVAPIVDSLVLVLILAPLLWRVVVMPLRKGAEDSGVILRTAMDGFWIVDMRGRFREVNEAYCRLVGYTREELLAMRISDVEAAESPAEIAGHVATITRTGSDRFLTRHRRKDGSVLDVEVSINRHPLNRGQFFVFVRDVTERRRAESALRQLTGELEQRVAERTADLEAANRTLREGERGLREAQEVGRVGSYDFDIQADLWRSSAIMDAIFGIGADYPRTAATWGKLVHPSQRQEMLSYLAEIIAGHRRFEREYRIVRANDGEARWVVGLGEVEYGPDGMPLRMVGTIQDITERKGAEAALRLQSAALNAASDAMSITDRDGTIVWVNPAFTAVTGYRAEEAIGRNPRELVKSGVHDQAFYKHLWDTLLAGEVWHGELTNRRKDGSLYTEEQTITPVTDAGGEITHFIAIKRDQTDKKLMEAQFLQSQKMETVGQLAGGIAHDFNNLLTVINSTAELAALELREGDPLREELAAIRDAGARAAALTRQLLAFSRKQILMPRVLNLGALVADEEDMLQRLIGEDIDLVVSAANAVGNVRADPAQIEQVIMNLAVNARDAMPGGGTLMIETRDVELDEAYAATHPSLKPGPHVLLAVSDTGVGMDEATRLRIFEPFFTTKPTGRGTGLGLSTVYGIVKQSGGSIWVYSEPGHGTTFKVYLPRVEESAQQRRPERAIVPVPGTETILVVEDQEGLRPVVERILRRSGYTVLTAGNGEEALRTLELHDGPVQLMLTDVVMPGMHGPALAARIAEVRPGIKVLYTSGYADEVMLRHGLIDDTVHFIGKPFEIDALTRKVREVLNA